MCNLFSPFRCLCIWRGVLCLMFSFFFFFFFPLSFPGAYHDSVQLCFFLSLTSCFQITTLFLCFYSGLLGSKPGSFCFLRTRDSLCGVFSLTPIFFGTWSKLPSRSNNQPIPRHDPVELTEGAYPGVSVWRFPIRLRRPCFPFPLYLSSMTMCYECTMIPL